LLAALGVAVLVIALIALRHPNRGAVHAGAATTTPSRHTESVVSSPTPSPSSSRTTPSSSPKPKPRSTPPPTPQTVPKLPLVVLNNTTITGLAAQAAERFRTGGWPVTSVGNLQNVIISTCAYYDPSVPDARASARELQREYPTIKRVEPKFPELPPGPIVVVLTPDYS
jgi:hypothetical protein